MSNVDRPAKGQQGWGIRSHAADVAESCRFTPSPVGNTWQALGRDEVSLVHPYRQGFITDISNSGYASNERRTVASSFACRYYINCQAINLPKKWLEIREPV